MSTMTDRQIIPVVGIRVPGPWKNVKQLAARLAGGCCFEGEHLVMPDGFPVGFEAKPADRVFPDIFRSACRRPAQKTELAGLDEYKMIAMAVLPGGSTQAAERILETAAHLVRAGGFGVFIDNGAIAHGASDWFELAENRNDADAVFYSFISFAKSAIHIASHGMHVLGQPDAVLDHDSKLDEAIDSLEDFLRACAKGRIAAGNAEFEDTSNQHFRLTKERDHNPFGDRHPIHNPYGRWRLTACK
jgi:hypothetical protein